MIGKAVSHNAPSQHVVRQVPCDPNGSVAVAEVEQVCHRILVETQKISSSDCVRLVRSDKSKTSVTVADSPLTLAIEKGTNDVQKLHELIVRDIRSIHSRTDWSLDRI